MPVKDSRTKINVQSDYEATSGDRFIKNKPIKFIHLTKSATQNLGGANGTVNYVNWDSSIYKDDEFTHSISVNSSRIQVTKDGRYSLYALMVLLL